MATTQPMSRLRVLAVLGLGLVLTPIGLGLPMVALAVGELLATSHGQPSSNQSTAAGWIAVLVLGGAAVSGVAFGMSMVTPLELYFGDEDRALGLTAIVAPLAAGLVFAPLAFAPSLALEEPRGAWLIDSIWMSAHLGVGRVALVGLQLGAHAAFPFASAWAVGAGIDEDLGILAFPAGCVATVLAAPLTFRQLARELARARIASRDEHAVRALVGLARLSLLPIAVLCAAFTLAAAAPLPPVERETQPVEVEGSPFPHSIAGTDLIIESEPGRVDVRRGDGSAPATTLRFRPWISMSSVDVEAIEHRGERVFRITLHDRYGYRDLVLRVDREGRRQGDGIVSRLDRRMSRTALVLLALASWLGVLLALRMGLVHTRVRELAALIRGDDAHLGVVAGVLRVAGGPVKLVGGRLVSGGGASVEAEGGALRIALPEGSVEALASAPLTSSELPDGTRIAVIARGARLGGVGPRSASVAFPPGGAVVIGELVAAQRAMVRRSFGANARLAIVLGSTVVLAALAIGVASS